MDTLLKLTDEALVLSYAQGDNSAFDILLNRHKNRIFTHINHLVRDYDLANDIFQDTFVKVVMTIKQGRYIESGKFLAWVMRIAHNLVIDHYRQTKSENVFSSDEADYNLFNRKEFSDETIEIKLVRSQIDKDLNCLVEALPENQKQVLKMRYYEDLSFKEIAALTGVSINTALGRMRYAILNIRRLADENQISLTVA